MRYAAVLFAASLALAAVVAAQVHDSAVPTTPKSIADGGTLFSRNCASCHGKAGMGDGPAAKQLTPPPSNLVDAEWKHGATDNEIFAVIRSGVPKTPMKGFASKLTEHEIGDVINYLRSIGPKP